MNKTILKSAFIFPLLLALAIYFGGPSAVKPLESISDPFKGVDFSDVPKPKNYKARDGAALSYHHYQAANAKGAVVLIHGSSASGASLHLLAKALNEIGYEVFKPDMRGHGASGERGKISYIGQLEHDLEDLMKEVKPSKATLLGFSSGGGFALRFAGGKSQELFDNTLLLAPFISHEAPTYKPNGGGWVSVGIPRLVAISIINGFGISYFNTLPVTTFAVKPTMENVLTKSYSYALMQNFKPQSEYKANIEAVKKPMSIVIGAEDEVFNADKFKEVFPNHEVKLLPNIKHVTLTLDEKALEAIVAAVNKLNGK